VLRDEDADTTGIGLDHRVSGLHEAARLHFDVVEGTIRVDGIRWRLPRRRTMLANDIYAGISLPDFDEVKTFVFRALRKLLEFDRFRECLGVISELAHWFLRCPVPFERDDADMETRSGRI
jgi:hypothetical protein